MLLLSSIIRCLLTFYLNIDNIFTHNVLYYWVPILFCEREGTYFPIIFGCLLLFAVYYFSTTNVQLAFSQEYIFERKFGSAGTALGEFSQPQGIAIDSSDNIYITSFTSLSNQIQKFTSNGTFITWWGSLGFGSGRFTNPSGITTDSLNNVYVADFGENNNVQKFDSNGNFIMKWGSLLQQTASLIFRMV